MDIYAKRTLFRRAIQLALVFAFALLFAASISAILYSDYLRIGEVVELQERRTIRLCAYAGAISILICWALLSLVKSEGFISKLIYCVFMLFITYGGVGGVLVIVQNKLVYGTFDAQSLYQGYFWASLSGFYSFAIYLFSAAKLSLFILFLTAAFYLVLLAPSARRGWRFGKVYPTNRTQD